MRSSSNVISSERLQNGVVPLLPFPSLEIVGGSSGLLCARALLIIPGD